MLTIILHFLSISRNFVVQELLLFMFFLLIIFQDVVFYLFGVCVYAGFQVPFVPTNVEKSGVNALGRLCVVYHKLAVQAGTPEAKQG